MSALMWKYDLCHGGYCSAVCRVFFFVFKWVQCSPRWAERFISSHECWLWALSPPPHFHSFSVPSFLTLPISMLISFLLNEHLSDLIEFLLIFWFVREIERNPCAGVKLAFCTPVPGCLGPLCMLSWLEWTVTPPAWVKSGSLCSLFFELWFWLWRLRVFGEMNSLTSPVTPYR